MTDATKPPQPLHGRSILVVEDEYFQAKDLAQALSGAGARLVGPFPSLEAALAALDQGDGIDAAVLDINLRGRMVHEVADVLAARDIPFLFATGYDTSLVPAGHRTRPLLTKPFRIESLLAAVAELCNAPADEGAARQGRQGSSPS